MTTHPKDIIVIGAGLVGAIQALLLARAGNKVIVVERRSLLSTASVQDHFSSRTVALSHRTWQLLCGGNLWPSIDHCAIDTIHVTEQGKFGSVTINARDVSVEALGFVLSNTDFECYLHRLLKAEPGVEILEASKVQSLHQSTDKATLIVEQQGHEQEIIADLLIAADGTGSAIRSMLGLTVDERDYQQCAVLANVATTKPHQHKAYERFTSAGPLALLPLSTKQDNGHVFSMIFTAAAADKEWLHGMSDEEFLSLLQKKFGGKLGRFEKIGKRVVAPLMLTVSARQVESRCVLIGNAARTLHPVAGQGLNLAVRDVFELASCLDSNSDVGLALKEFGEKRRRDQVLVTRHTDLLARAFTQKSWPLRMPLSVASSSSFLLLDFLNPLKRKFAQVSMGHHVPLPR